MKTKKVIMFIFVCSVFAVSLEQPPHHQKYLKITLLIAHCKNDLEERRLSANAFLSEQCVADMVAELGITLVNAVCVNYIPVDT